ncbi:hypothetical protein O181_005511 [Austropuccinia psidii MF-1]|uniref:Uncharacterized protein n=1 Tax=Austropuccinia psidii MF-1 TaxID=1389203 RepID=A0A9Q3BHD8_9BASI|nr:hypothetical protein [Austropuccinia psidii MF-1]
MASPPDGTPKEGMDNNILTHMIKEQNESSQEEIRWEYDATSDLNTIIPENPQQLIAASGLVTFLRGIMDDTQSIKPLQEDNKLTVLKKRY